MAMPMPPPMQRAATPRFKPVRLSAWIKVTRIRAPDAPRGWPSAIAPPLILIYNQ